MNMVTVPEDYLKDMEAALDVLNMENASLENTNRELRLMLALVLQKFGGRMWITDEEILAMPLSPRVNLLRESGKQGTKVCLTYASRDDERST